ncbi:MAG: DUF58 domain-containing protein [Actinomycetota bacterium]
MLVPRRRGAGLVLGATLLFTIGTSVQAGWVLVLSAVVLGTAVTGALLPLLFVRGVDVERRVPAEAFQGDEVEVELLVTGRSRGIRLGVDVADAFLSVGRVAVPSLARGERVGVGTMRRAVRRGVQEDDRAVVCSAAPFGIAEARSVVRAPARTVVYPAVAHLDGVPLIDEVPTFEHSIHTAPRRGGGPEYLGIREYRAGDSMRHVHWPSTAHHGHVMVREFEREHTRRVAVVIDTSADAGRPVTPLDAACAVAASIAFAALANGHGVRLIAARDGRLDAIGRASGPALLEWLAELRPFGGLSVAEVAGALPEHLRGVEALLVVVPSWRSNAGVATPLSAVQRLVERVGAIVIDAAAFEAAGSAAMNGAAVDDLFGHLTSAGIEAYRVGAGEDLSRCLSRPLVASR